MTGGRLKAIQTASGLGRQNDKEGCTMSGQDSDWDNLDAVLEDFDGVVVEGGVDAADEDDNCADGACKI